MLRNCRTSSLRRLLLLFAFLLANGAHADDTQIDVRAAEDTVDHQAPDMHGDGHTAESHTDMHTDGRAADTHADGPAAGHAHGAHDMRADGYAPIGVMGEHMHEAGTFMFSYRYMRMRMDGNRDGTNNLTPSEVLARGFMATPTDMDTNMHMFGAMYAPTDWLTVGVMMPYVEKSMDHLMGTGMRFETKSDGAGDLTISSMLRLWETETHHFHLNFGVGFPTGSINHKDFVPVPGMGFQKRRLPYPMQIGSGSYFLKPGLTYTGKSRRLSWGGQAMGTIYLNENDNDYTVGDRVDLTAWLAVPVVPWLSLSARALGKIWGNYSGADPTLNPMAISTADPKRRGGEEIDLAPGLNLEIPLGPLGKHHIAIEALLPVYRSLDGPQLEHDWSVVVGWQKAF